MGGHRCYACCQENCGFYGCTCGCHDEFTFGLAKEEEMSSKKTEGKLTDAQAEKAVQQKLTAASVLIKEARELADEYEVEFTFCFDELRSERTFTYTPKQVADEEVASALGKLTDSELEALGHCREDFEIEGRFRYDWLDSDC